MRNLIGATIAAAAVATLAAAATAGAQPQRGPGGPGGPGGRGRGGPPAPVMMVLDENCDGILDSGEIARAPQSLLKLDRNGDGQLTQDELRPPRPEDGQQPPAPPCGGQRPPQQQ